MQRNAPFRAFTIVEAAVVIILVAVAAALLLPMTGCGLAAARNTARQIQNSTQLRGIQQSMVIFAQSNKVGGYEGFYPGLNSDGSAGNIHVEDRFKTLLDNNAFTPEYLINPVDSGAQMYDAASGKPFTAKNYSYAALQIPVANLTLKDGIYKGGGRHAEWRKTINTNAIVLADRNVGTTAQPSSLWHKTWEGSTVRNDNSTMFEQTHVFALQYGKVPSTNDHLFEAAGEDDAYLVHSGN